MPKTVLITVAPGSVADGAETLVWLTEAEEGPNGKFLRKRQVISW